MPRSELSVRKKALIDLRKAKKAIEQAIANLERQDRDNRDKAHPKPSALAKRNRKKSDARTAASRAS